MDEIKSSAAVLKQLVTFEHKDSWKFYVGAAVAVVGASLIYSSKASSRPKNSKKRVKKSRKQAKVVQQGSMVDELTVKSESEPLLTRVDSKFDEKELLPAKFTPKNFESMSVEEKKVLSAECKNYGNEKYKSKLYEEAIEAYTQAIKLHPDAIYYSNRAACYSMLNNHAMVLEDCDAALNLNPTFGKVYKRRAITLEKLNRPFEAIEDYMTVSFMGGFNDSAVSESMDAVLKQCAKKETEELMQNRAWKAPSKVVLCTFLDTFPSLQQYINSYRDLSVTEDMSQSESNFIQAMSAFGDAEHEKAAELLQKVKFEELKDKTMLNDAKLMQATMLCLCGNATRALELLDAVLTFNPKNSAALLRKSAALLESGSVESAIAVVEEAISADAKDAEAYFQRSQIVSLMVPPSQHMSQMAAVMQQALADLEKATELNPNYLMAKIQLGVLKMRMGAEAEGEKLFKELLDQHGSTNANVWNYWGEVNMTLNKADLAFEAFDKAYQIDTENPVPLINKSVAALQLSQDLAGAEKFVKEAIKVDPFFDLPHVQLGQIYLAKNEFDKAIECYHTAIDNAHSESDIFNYSSCLIASKAQKNVFKRNPSLLDQVKEMVARGM